MNQIVIFPRWFSWSCAGDWLLSSAAGDFHSYHLMTNLWEVLYICVNNEEHGLPFDSKKKSNFYLNCNSFCLKATSTNTIIMGQEPFLVYKNPSLLCVIIEEVMGSFMTPSLLKRLHLQFIVTLGIRCQYTTKNQYIFIELTRTVQKEKHILKERKGFLKINHDTFHSRKKT